MIYLSVVVPIMSDTEPRASFNGKMGFIIASAAAAVGLGNLWRFPYLASHYGGGIFVLVYIILAVTFGFSLMVAEVALGRKTGKSCILAFGELCSKYKWLGILAGTVPILVVSYYLVIGGWVAKWFTESALGNLGMLSADNGSYWSSFITGAAAGISDPMAWFFIFMLLCVVCVALGVDRGIEKLSNVLMPMLLVMIIGITAYEMTLPGIWDGVVFYLNPDISKLNGGTFLGAVSQIFYSMSLAMGIMITYGSYMRKDVSIEKSARYIGIVDTTVAILAGLLIIPSAFMMGLQDSAGMGLMFVSLPQVFEQMPGGVIVAPVFYLMVLVAALTSAVALLETTVSMFVDLKAIRRNKSLIISIIVVSILGALCVLGFGPLMTDLAPFDQGAGFLGIFDNLTNSILMPIVAILTCVFIGYVVKVAVISDEVKAEGNEFASERIFTVMIKYLCPIFLGAMLLFWILDILGVFSVYG